jgi:uncharacterized MAPEG superfamily protein
MSYTETGRTAERSRSARSVRNFRETKPSFETTEFWAMIAGIAAVVVIYLASADTSFNLWRAMVLGTVIGVGYIISRGIAKAGSHDDRWDVRDPDTWRNDPRHEGR